MDLVDEFPDVSFYVLSEPALTAPEPDEIGIWQELARLRTENHRWRDCVMGILADVEHYRGSRDVLLEAIEKRVISLGVDLARIHHR